MLCCYAPHPCNKKKRKKEEERVMGWLLSPMCMHAKLCPFFFQVDGMLLASLCMGSDFFHFIFYLIKSSKITNNHFNANHKEF